MRNGSHGFGPGFHHHQVAKFYILIECLTDGIVVVRGFRTQVLREFQTHVSALPQNKLLRRRDRHGRSQPGGVGNRLLGLLCQKRSEETKCQNRAACHTPESHRILLLLCQRGSRHGSSPRGADRLPSRYPLSETRVSLPPLQQVNEPRALQPRDKQTDSLGRRRTDDSCADCSPLPTAAVL